jgi:hypothetical protein
MFVIHSILMQFCAKGYWCVISDAGGPFFISYCIGMETHGIYGDVCVVMSPGAIISMLDMFDRNRTKGMVHRNKALYKSYIFT